MVSSSRRLYSPKYLPISMCWGWIRLIKALQAEPPESCYTHTHMNTHGHTSTCITHTITQASLTHSLTHRQTDAYKHTYTHI